MIYEYDTKYINEIFRNKKRILSHELIKVLLYFDIFHYPLTAKEIKRFCASPATIDEVEYELGFLERLGYIQQKDIFYSISPNDMPFMVERRRKGNEKAVEMMKKANGYSKLISYFPFVRGIYLSGSLSKGYADENSDVDYFIITEPGRLWLCRMLLTLFKKIFLFNSHKYFCINYFIDTESLEIPDKNIFTAIELTTLITTSNRAL